MFLSLDTCHDPDRDQSLTTTATFALVEVYRGEVRERSLLEVFFSLYLWYLQSEGHLVYLFASLRSLKLM